MKNKAVYRTTLAFLLTLLAFSVFSPQVVAQNTPPVADAGPDQEIFVGEAAQLSGTAIDPDGDPIVAWTWTIESKPVGSSPLLSGSFTPTPILVPDLIGDYVISLVVSDGIDDSLPDTVTVSVIENLPPVAIPTADVTSGPAPLTVNFDGSQSYDPEGGLILIRWDFGDGSPATDEIAPVHTYDLPDQYVALLGVMDDAGQSDQDTIEITVYGSPSVPVGGIFIPVNKLELLAPYIGLTSLLAVAVVTVVFFKHKKRKP